MIVHTETVLRDALTAGAARIDASADPWPGFARRERSHRRRRRVGLAALAAVLVAAGGVQAGLAPLPGWTPGIPVAGSPGPLTDAPARGNLAADQAWLAGMRQAVTDVHDPGQIWRVADRSKITFPYAAELPGRRLVLASVPLRFGLLADRALIWYEGDPGAQPTEMRESGRVDGGEPVVTFLAGHTDKPGALVVVAPPDSTVGVSVGFRYTAEGRVEHAQPVTGTGGLAEIALPPAPTDPGVTVTVRAGGDVLFSGPPAGSWSGRAGEETQEPGEAMLTAASAGHTVDRSLLRSWVRHALGDARLPAAGTTVRVRWTGTVDGQPAMLFTLRPAGGGVLAYALHGNASAHRQNLRLLLPAAGADRRPIAWRMRAAGKDDPTPVVFVVAPPGTARLTMAAGGDPVTLIPDAAGLASTTLDPERAASVTAHAADGTALGTTPVTPLETDLGGIPGADLNTRIVP